MYEVQFPDIGRSNRVVIFGNYGDGNVGDEAMLDVLLDLLTQRRVKEVIVPSRAPENLKNMHPNRIFRAVGIMRGAFSALFADTLIIGGGTLFSHYSGKGIYPMLVISIIRKLLTRRKTIFYGIGYSSSTPDSLKQLARIAFKIADGVYVRDSNSYKLLSEDFHMKKLFLVRELAFSLKPNSDCSLPSLISEKRDRHKTLIGLSLLYTFSSNDKRMMEAITEFIISISEKIDAGFVFLTFNPAFIDKQGIRRSDEKAGKEIVNNLPEDIASRCIILPLYSPDTTLRIISQIDCIISMRYHCLVFAYMEKKPYIAISFEEKHSAFIQDFGGEMIDFAEMSAEELVRIWQRIYK